MKYTNSQKVNGSHACRYLSGNALSLFLETDPLYVYEYEKDGETLYAYSGVFGDAEDMTFAELQKNFEDLADTIEEDYYDY